jgi:hypothetical protein
MKQTAILICRLQKNFLDTVILTGKAEISVFELKFWKEVADFRCDN